MFRSLTNTYAKFYFAHLLVVFAAFLILARDFTTPVTNSSGFGTFISRTKTVVKYMWPKDEIYIRFCIIGSFAIVILGRAINLLAPIYAKYIGLFQTFYILLANYSSFS